MNKTKYVFVILSLCMLSLFVSACGVEKDSRPKIGKVIETKVLPEYTTVENYDQMYMVGKVPMHETRTKEEVYPSVLQVTLKLDETNTTNIYVKDSRYYDFFDVGNVVVLDSTIYDIKRNQDRERERDYESE